MKNSRRNSLLAALLVCLAPAAASAAEGYLTPSKNGGSGAMPSGYTKLYFELAPNDFVADLALPANPRDKDQVILSSLAGLSSRLDASRTGFADLAYIPVERFTNIELVWNGYMKQWEVVGGLSGRVLFGTNEELGYVPETEHSLTQIVLANGQHFQKVYLPQNAPKGALLTVSNRATWGTAIEQPSGGTTQSCAANQDCSYVFSADGKWHARHGREHYQPTHSQMPKLEQRWTDIVTGSAAEDSVTPPYMVMPVTGVEGDIVQLSDPSNSNLFRVSGGDTKGAILSAKPITLRYDSQKGLWARQAD